MASIEKAPNTTVSPVGSSRPERLDDNDKRVLSSIRRIVRAVDLRSRRLAACWGITGPQLACLDALCEEDSLTVSELSDCIHLSSSTLVGILDRLEAKGYVRRERRTDDRRKVSVAATERGRAFSASVLTPVRDSFADAFERLAPDMQEDMATSLERVITLMEAWDVPAHPVMDVPTYDQMVAQADNNTEERGREHE